MAASRFSSNVIKMFCGPISREENARLLPPLRPIRDFDFQLERTNLNQWLRVWKMKVLQNYKFKAKLLNFAQKKKSRFAEMLKNEIEEKKKWGKNKNWSATSNREIP